jgi:tetratricopeptide (TPR) repeat protein
MMIPPASGPEGQPMPALPGFDRATQQQHLNEAVNILTRLVEASPRVAAYRHLLAKCLREFPAGAPRPGQSLNDPSALDQSIALFEGLVAEYPTAAQYRFDLCTTYAMSPPGEDSDQRLEKAMKLMEALARERPNVPSYQFALAHLCLRSSQWNREHGFLPEAIDNIRQAIRIQGQLAEKFPKIVPYAFATAFYESDLGRMMLHEQDFAQARTYLEQSVKRLESFPPREANKPHVRHLLVMCYDHLSEVLEELSADKEARSARDKVKLYQQPPSSMPSE